MARIKERDDLSKHTLHLYAGDYGELQSLHPDVGAAAVVRRIVRRYISELKAKAGVKEVSYDE